MTRKPRTTEIVTIHVHLGQGFFWVARLATGSSIAVEANVLANCSLDPDLVVAPFFITAPPYSNLNDSFHAVRKIRDQSTVAKLATWRELERKLTVRLKSALLQTLAAVSAQLHTQVQSVIPNSPLIDSAAPLPPHHNRCVGTEQNKLSADCFRFEPGNYFREFARLLSFVRHNLRNSTLQTSQVNKPVDSNVEWGFEMPNNEPLKNWTQHTSGFLSPPLCNNDRRPCSMVQRDDTGSSGEHATGPFGTPSDEVFAIDDAFDTLLDQRGPLTLEWKRFELKTSE